MALKLSRAEKNKEINRRFEIFKSLMSSFVIGTAAIIIAVVFVPTSPKAEIIKANALIDTVTYQVSVTDKANALDLTTLVVSLENQIEHYEHEISLGESSGYFDSLTPNTDYWLNVYGSKGYGQERLDSIKLTTRDKTGAFILGVDEQQVEWETTYTIDVLVNDPDNLYNSINLYYGYRWEPETDLMYTAIPITTTRQQIEIFDIYTSLPFHVYIAGMLDGDTVILDEQWVTPSFQLYDEMFLNYIGDDTIGLMMYGGMTDIDIAYHVNVYRGSVLLKRIEVDIGTSMHGSTFPISGLLPNTTYRLEGVATYTNPQTLRNESQIIYDEEVTTLADYQISYQIVSYEAYLEATITIVDPNHYFQLASYELIDVTGEMPIYIMSETFSFTANGHSQSTTFIIMIPTDITYQVIIDVRSETNYMIRHIIYDEISE